MLAGEIGVSIRTLYRDIASLQAQGAEIEGEPGVGYILRPGFLLPPLMFPPEEIEALALGARWVAAQRLGLYRSVLPWQRVACLMELKAWETQGSLHDI